MPDTSQLPLLPLIIAGTGAGILSVGGLLAYSVFMPRCGFWAPVIRSLPQSDGVAVTFDDGPHEEFTPRILDILAQHRVKASFFVIGRYARQYPALVRRIFEEGHSLGNHTLDHDRFGVNGKRNYWDNQLRQTQEIVADITGQPPMLFRPPMGFKTWHIAAAAKALQLPMVGWSIRGLDTRPSSPEQLAERVLKRTTGHDIILLHDGVEPNRPAGASQSHTVAALPAILEGIAEKKLQAVSLVEALVAGSDDIREAVARTRARAASS